MKIQDKIIQNLEWGNKRLKEINKGLSEEQLEILEFCLLNDTKQFVIPVVSESVTCWNCNGWGYTLLPNGKRDKHCTVCDGSNVR